MLKNIQRNTANNSITAGVGAILFFLIAFGTMLVAGMVSIYLAFGWLGVATFIALTVRVRVAGVEWGFDREISRMAGPTIVALSLLVNMLYIIVEK